jgi:hypothetical protein
MIHRVYVNIVVSLLLLSVFSCGHPHESEGLSTPRGAIYQVSSAIGELDPAKALASVTGTPEELKQLSAQIRFWAAIKDFKTAIIGEYGNSGWTHFDEEGGAELSFHMDKVDSDLVKGLTIEVNDDTATVIDTGTTLHRKDGSWYSKAGDVVNMAGADAETLMALSLLLKRKSAEIGKEGVTAESLDRELGEDIVSIISQSTGRMPLIK